MLRIDCAHGEVHQRRFLRNGKQDRTVFPPLTSRNAGNALETWCARASAMVDYEWRDYLKEWTDDFSMRTTTGAVVAAGAVRAGTGVSQPSAEARLRRSL